MGQNVKMVQANPNRPTKPTMQKPKQSGSVWSRATITPVCFLDFQNQPFEPLKQKTK